MYLFIGFYIIFYLLLNYYFNIDSKSQTKYNTQTFIFKILKYKLHDWLNNLSNNTFKYYIKLDECANII